jgi:hypothetical protein
MEAICSSETSVDTQRTTRRNIPEDDTLQNHRCENIKSYTIYLFIYILIYDAVNSWECIAWNDTE